MCCPSIWCLYKILATYILDSSEEAEDHEDEEEEEEEDDDDDEEDDDDDEEDDGEEFNQKRYELRQRKAVVPYQVPLQGKYRP